jgi:hypothetical protein
MGGRGEGGDKGGKYSAQGENEGFGILGQQQGKLRKLENEEEDELGKLKVIFMFVIPLNLAAFK